MNMGVTRRSLLGGAGAGLVGACTASLTETKPLAKRVQPVKIMCVGDSITYGANSTDGLGYRSVLEQELRDVGQNPVMMNASMNGRRLDIIRPDIDAAIAANGPPDITLWFLGTNDWKNQALWPEWYSKYYNEIARVLQMSSTGKAAVASVPLAVGYEGSFRNINAWVRDITCVWLARDFPGRAKFVNLASLPQSFLAGGNTGGGDTVHPGDAGYELIARMWLQAIRGWLP